MLSGFNNEVQFCEAGTFMNPLLAYKVWSFYKTKTQLSSVVSGVSFLFEPPSFNFGRLQKMLWHGRLQIPLPL